MFVRTSHSRLPSEQLRLRTAHPGEDDVFVCRPHNPDACYVKGRLQLTRAIGDIYLKYKEFNAPAGLHRSAGRHIPDPYTPPYVSHIPEIHHLNLGSEEKFLILATDGVWDFLSAEEAVNIVAACHEERLKKKGRDDSETMGDRDRNLASEAAALLVQKTLERAADDAGLQINHMLELEPGRDRRRVHDDTTAVVLWLD